MRRRELLRQGRGVSQFLESHAFKGGLVIKMVDPPMLSLKHQMSLAQAFVR
jgi:hypothetical protein